MDRIAAIRPRRAGHAAFGRERFFVLPVLDQQDTQPEIRREADRSGERAQDPPHSRRGGRGWRALASVKPGMVLFLPLPHSNGFQLLNQLLKILSSREAVQY